MNKAEGRLALARFIQYCEDEAIELNLPFVSYCLALAGGALAEEVDRIDSGARAGVPSLRRKGD